MKRMMSLVLCMAFLLICMAGCNAQISDATSETPLAVIPEAETTTAAEIPQETTAEDMTANTTYPPATVPTQGTTYPPATVPIYTNGSSATSQTTSVATTTSAPTISIPVVTETTTLWIPPQTETTTTAHTTTVATTQTPVVIPPVSGSVDFGGREFTILCSEGSIWANWDTIYEIYPNEKTDAISLALEKRNQDIEAQYHCGIKFVISAHPLSNVLADKTANRDTVDLFADSIFYHQNALKWDVCYNLYGLDIDLGASYFNQNWIDAFTVRTEERGNTLYSVIGDFSFGELMDANVLFYNKALFASRFPNVNLEELVESGSWTWDALMGFVKNGAEDMGEEGFDPASTADIYGLHHDGVYAFFASSGATFVKNSDGAMRFDMDGKDTYSAVIDEIIKLFNADEVRQGKIYRETDTYVHGGRALFMAGTIAMADEFVSEGVLGVLPYPKLTAEQKYYATALDNVGPLAYAIPTHAKNIDMAAAFLEVFAEHSQTTLKPVIYEVYGEKYGSADMITLIEESLIFDPAYHYWNGDIAKAILDPVSSGKNKIDSYFERIGSTRFDEGYENLLNVMKKSKT
jgi:hypothetical protein